MGILVLLVRGVPLIPPDISIKRTENECTPAHTFLKRKFDKFTHGEDGRKE